jgi:hypothetical protein
MHFRTVFALIAFAYLCAAAQPSHVKRAIADPFDNVCIPHIVAGLGWKTTITIVNMDPTPSTFSLMFVDTSGNDLRMPLNTPSGPSTTTEVSGTLPPNGSATYETVGGGNLLQAWALLVHNGLSGLVGKVSGQAVFTQEISGRPVFEAVVPISAFSERRVRLPFDNKGFQMGVALVNFDSTSASITGTAYDENGQSLGTGSLSLVAGGQRAFLLKDAFAFTAGQRGMIELSSSARSMCSLGLRFHPGGAFTSTAPLSLPTW